MLEVNIHKLRLKNPVMTASGTFGYGEEFADFIDINRLGGIIVKGTTGSHREGNPYPRMAETPSGMLNAVGLQNVGVDAFCQDIYPRISTKFNTNIIVNVSGSTIDEYCDTAAKINELDNIPAIELNISCPNVKKGGMGQSLKGLKKALFGKAAQLVFEMKILRCTDDNLDIDFHYCPLVKAWQKQGCSDEEIRLMCDHAMCGDRGIAESFGCKLELPKTIAKGDGVCQIRFVRK